MEHFVLAFPLDYQNVYDHQTFQDGDMLQRVAWHLNGVVLWGHVTNKIYLHLQKMYQYCQTRQGANLVSEAPNMTLWSSDQHEVTWGHIGCGL